MAAPSTRAPVASPVASRGHRGAECGGLLLQHGYAREAMPILRRVLRKDPDCVEALVNLGAAHRALGQFAEAGSALARAVQLDPRRAAAWNNLGMLREDLGQFEGATVAYESALARDPSSQQIKLNCAYSLLREGRFAEAWPYWEEGRLVTALGLSFSTWRPIPGVPILQPSDDIRDRDVVVVRDGGYGDAILFSRWLPELLRRGAKATFVVWEPILSLLAAQPWLAGVTFHPDWLPVPENCGVLVYDFQCALMSLPAVLGCDSVEAIPPSDRFEADEAKVDVWKARVVPADKLLRVGICWRAEETAVARPHRSVPITALTPLRAIKRVVWYSLLPRPRENEVPDWITDLTGEINDWSDTAALIANLDLVVSVDTAVAHLAAAMGQRTWILVPHRSDWKWFLGRDDSPFYPSARLFRQEAPRRWASTVRRIVKELSQSLLERIRYVPAKEE